MTSIALHPVTRQSAPPARLGLSGGVSHRHRGRWTTEGRGGTRRNLWQDAAVRTGRHAPAHPPAVR
jgi:hypothetical protein